MDITKNLQLETRRLYSLGIDFRMFEHLKESGKVGVIVGKPDNTPENAQRLETAGYSQGRKRSNDAQLFTIEVKELEKIHEAKMRLIELEDKRLETSGIPYYGYDVSTDDKLVISIPRDKRNNETDLKLTEIGYNAVGEWLFRGGMSEFSIPFADLEEIHGISLAEDPE